jgi:sugar O-acyltransferase (sialic acid O-acetyltransferase NeuD family)
LKNRTLLAVPSYRRSVVTSESLGKKINMEGLKKIVILGTGGNSIDILDTINDINSLNLSYSYECIGFLDDNEQLWGKTLHGVKVLGPLCDASELKNCCFVNGIGAPSNFWQKASIISKTGVSSEKFETIVHPSAVVSRTAHIGRGTVIFQNVTITSNVKIGHHVIILPNVVISHDDIIGDYTCITAGVCISGGVNIGKLCYLGTNSAIIGNVQIGDYSLVGMGAVVLESVAQNSVVVGNPAKFFRHTTQNSNSIGNLGRSKI